MLASRATVAVSFAPHLGFARSHRLLGGQVYRGVIVPPEYLLTVILKFKFICTSPVAFTKLPKCKPNVRQSMMISVFNIKKD